MKKNLTELVFILDRSGSMAGLESDTIGGYNGLLIKQKNEVGEAIITTVLFDDKYELLHDRINICGVAQLTHSDYYVRGCTALLDAVGKSITKIRSAQEHTLENERPDKTLVVITTDGLENASCEYTKDSVKTMISEMQNKGWEFIFIGANIDSVSVAGDIGIKPECAIDYHADSEGTAATFDSVCAAASQMRACSSVDSSWRKSIEEDEKKRNKK